MGNNYLDPKCFYSLIIDSPQSSITETLSRRLARPYIPSVFENNWTKMSRRRRLCCVLYLLSAESCSLCCSTPAAIPTPTIPSFLLSLLHRVLVVLSLLSFCSVCLAPCSRAWWLALGLIISVHSETGGDHCSPQVGSSAGSAGRSDHVVVVVTVWQADQDWHHHH